ncbi:hypothetical protein [Lachnobacterium bovis]|uniref:hypothetical protein n=1 Tax=Lachnobacterium bovis TaxID=140626 RepID=UPI00048C3B86|nr:hypothetical protein [Lachnobacterium bovis]
MFENISIRGRMAYMICSFEKLLLYYECNKEEWKGLLEKLWKYTSTEFLDDWMYEIAEYMPESVLEDSFEGAEFISVGEYTHLQKLYRNTDAKVLSFLRSVFECGTCDLYSKLYNYSPNTIKCVRQATDILKNLNIELMDAKLFEKYAYTDCNGWGFPFEGKKMSIIL